MKTALIKINDAVALKQFLMSSDSNPSLLSLVCISCGQPVSTHNDGQPGQGPHFEHIRGNPLNCPPKR